MKVKYTQNSLLRYGFITIYVLALIHTHGGRTTWYSGRLCWWLKIGPSGSIYKPVPLFMKEAVANHIPAQH